MAATGFAVKVAAGMIGVYQHCFRVLKPPCCRFQPSCSQYAREALLAFGLWRGARLAVGRLLRCHPLYRGAVYDPVPPAGQAGTGHAAGTREPSASAGGNRTTP